MWLKVSAGKKVRSSQTTMCLIGLCKRATHPTVMDEVVVVVQVREERPVDLGDGHA